MNTGTSSSLLVKMFFNHAELRPNEPFMVSPEGREITFSQAADRTLTLAKLLEKKTGSGSVLLSGKNDVAWVIGLLASRFANLPVIILPVDTLPEEETRLASMSGAAVRLEAGFGHELTSVQQLPYKTDRAWDAGVCFVTSGSTGLPRLVLRPEESLASEGERYEKLLGLNYRDRILTASLLSHAYGFGLGLMGSLQTGCCLHLAPIFNPRACIKRVSAESITVLALVPAMARLLCKVQNAEPACCLKTAMVGAGPVTGRLHREWLEKFRVPLSLNYGSSETGATLAALPPYPEGVTGLPMPTVEATAVPLGGGHGHLWLRVPEIFSGYLDDRGFTPAVKSPEGWYPTGDIVALEKDGFFRIVGRLSNTIRRGGKTINPMEVESQLKTHPEVEDAMVVGCPEMGEDAVKAYVEVTEGSCIESGAFYAHLSKRLAPHKIPTRWCITNRLERTAAGKPRPLSARGEQYGSLLSSLTAYKLSELIFACHHLGLLKVLSNDSQTPKSLAEQLSLDIEAVKTVLLILCLAGVAVRGEGDVYSLVDRMYWPGLEPVIEFEKISRHSWMSAESIADVLKNGRAGRLFERTVPEECLRRAYKSAMLAVYSRHVALYLLRLTRPPHCAKILEIGKTLGNYSLIVKEHDRGSASLLYSLRSPLSVVADGLTEGVRVEAGPWSGLAPEEAYNTMVIQNGIHSMPLGQSCEIFTGLRGLLADAGVLAITDIFLDSYATGEKGLFPDIVLLDWLTHGDLNFLYAREVVSALDRSGFEAVETFPVKGSPLQTIICKKGR